MLSSSDASASLSKRPVIPFHALDKGFPIRESWNLFLPSLSPLDHPRFHPSLVPAFLAMSPTFSPTAPPPKEPTAPPIKAPGIAPTPPNKAPIEAPADAPAIPPPIEPNPPPIALLSPEAKAGISDNADVATPKTPAPFPSPPASFPSFPNPLPPAFGDCESIPFLPPSPNLSANLP